MMANYNPLFGVYCADFETTGLTNLQQDGYVRVYLWSLVSADLNHRYYGTRIDEFIEKIVTLPVTKIYFHNLRFDGSFILDYLVTMGYQYGKDYTVIIDGMNVWYEICINCKKKQIRIWDSLKKFPGQSVASIAKMYGIEDKKDKPDFTRYIPIDYVPYKEEIEYCIHDSEIIAYAIGDELKNGHTSMTLSSDAFNDVKKCIGGFIKWRNKMPMLSDECDAFVRESYKGGWVYVNPIYQNRTLDDVTVYDVNSLYPYVMHDAELPYGNLIATDRKPSSDYLYVIKLSCEFQLKHNYLPTVQIKGNPLYLETEYLKHSDGETILTMTNIDYELFNEHYKVWNRKPIKYYVMEKETGMLADYIDYWTDIKIQAGKDGDKARRYLAKRFLNSPYGKTGMRIDRINKIPYLDENNRISFKDNEEKSEGIYVPYASFVCAQARKKTITGAQKHYHDFVYADTDSLHLLGDNHSGLDVDDYKLGYWKIEGYFEKGKYIRPKTYIHADSDYKVKEIKCAGMPDNVKAKCDWEHFRDGEIFDGKLMQKRVPGGVVLCPTTFQIKELI